MTEGKTIKAAKESRVLNVVADPPDIRDRYYEPALVQLKAELGNLVPELVLDQGTEGACTGFGLAAVINQLKHRGGAKDFRASPRMLYEMAKRHDEWPGEAYAGSSCRGAIRGWHNMGVCEADSWPYEANEDTGMLTIARAREARHNALGAYFRLRPVVSDYHAALNETGAIYVSARVHEGWSSPEARNAGELPRIEPGLTPTGGHAFAIVGYDRHGFIVQNSWGPRWGRDGFAVWLYEDWIETIMDGWAFRLALPTPQIFGLLPRSARVATGVEEAKRTPVKRFQIAGHFVHFDDGRYKEKDDYWSTPEDVRQTAALVAEADNKHYRHLMVYAHGGLNSPRASARRVHALKEGFKRNGIYPFHIMYDTGLAEEIKDTIARALGFAEARAAGFTDWTDKLIEDAVRKPVTPVWEEMKRDARIPFEARDSDGTDAIQAFASKLGESGKSIHLVGHSTGGVLIGHMLEALDRLGVADLVTSCSLMAPACTVDFYKQHYEPRLGGNDGNGLVVRLPKLTVYNLTDELEKDDHVAAAYRKSLLYLVSRALERSRNEPKALLGMAAYSKQLPEQTGLRFIYSDGHRKETASRSHGGFDNDPNTMNHVLASILGKRPAKPFTAEELRGY